MTRIPTAVARALLASLLFALLFLAVPRYARADTPPEKFAVLVGVSRLQNTPGLSLRGPKNDVPRVRQMLLDRYGFRPENIVSLEGDAATKGNIVSGIRERLVGRAQAEDLILFYYSGHGTLIAPEKGIDAPGLYKAFVPTDVRITHGPRKDGTGLCKGCDGTLCAWTSVDSSLLRYRELESALKGAQTKNIVIVLDACHSGIAARAGLTVRRWREEPDAPATPTGADSLSDLSGVTVLTACTAHETAKDAPFLRPTDPTLIAKATDADSASWYMGALTYYLLDTLRRDTAGTMTYRSVLESVRARLAGTGEDQTPEMEGAETRPFLALEHPVAAAVTVPSLPAAAAVPASSAEVVSVTGDAITLRGVADTALTPGSVFAGAGGTPAVRVARAAGLTANAYALAGTPKIGDRLAEAFHAFSAAKLRVTVRGATPAAADLRQRLTAAGDVQTVESGAPADAEIQIDSQGMDLSATVFRNQIALPVIAGTDVAELFPKVGRVLENLSALQLLTDLDNPGAPFHVEVRVNGRQSEKVAIDDHIALTARADRNCYLYLFDIDPAGKVTVLFPNKFVVTNRLTAGQVYDLPLEKVYRLRIEGPAGPELIKAVAAEQPLPLEIIARDKGDFSGLGDGAGQIARDLLAQLRSAVNAARPDSVRGIVVESDKGTASPISTTGWTTDTVSLDVVPKKP
jgi:hypothetical protein